MILRLITIATAAALAALPASAANADGPYLPEWMAGCWTTTEPTEWTDECWSSARVGSMFGYSRAGAGNQLELFEFMRIERTAADGGDTPATMGFIVNQGGSTWTRFEWQPSSELGVTFVNFANDYPQRIRYWREGKRLLAEISLADGSKVHRFTYKRAGR